jgi:hypothetical protein
MSAAHSASPKLSEVVRPQRARTMTATRPWVSTEMAHWPHQGERYRLGAPRRVDVEAAGYHAALKQYFLQGGRQSGRVDSLAGCQRARAACDKTTVTEQARVGAVVGNTDLKPSHRRISSVGAFSVAGALTHVAGGEAPSGVLDELQGASRVRVVVSHATGNLTASASKPRGITRS